MLSDGRFRSESFGQTWFAGKTAVLQAGNVTLVVTSRPVHLFDRSLFLAHGLDPRSSTSSWSSRRTASRTCTRTGAPA